jgi:hypothetical protein
MRFITDCRDCGSVVLRAEALALVDSPEASEAVYECPICLRVRTMALTRGSFAVLLACGVQVVSDDHGDPESPLTLLHLAEFQSLLSDDDAWREVLDQA